MPNWKYLGGGPKNLSSGRFGKCIDTESVISLSGPAAELGLGLVGRLGSVLPTIFALGLVARHVDLLSDLPVSMVYPKFYTRLGRSSRPPDQLPGLPDDAQPDFLPDRPINLAPYLVPDSILGSPDGLPVDLPTSLSVDMRIDLAVNWISHIEF